jgi:hypothetical protein
MNLESINPESGVFAALEYVLRYGCGTNAFDEISQRSSPKDMIDTVIRQIADFHRARRFHRCSLEYIEGLNNW